MTAAVLTFLGIITGAALQYFFTRHLESRRHLRDLRTQSYTDYLRCVAERANLVTDPRSQATREIFAKTADAKARVCLYGSREAVERFSHFESLGAMMKDKEMRNAFCSMVSTMRVDSGSEAGLSIADIEMVLLGNHSAMGAVLDDI